MFLAAAVLEWYSSSTSSTSSLGPTVGPPPGGEHCPILTRTVHARTPTHAQAAPRRTLSFTIASQTIASSPDGSVISSAASSACGPPEATVGCGCRFRASSTVTSSSSPCNEYVRSFRERALEPAGVEARSAHGSAFLAAHCPVLNLVAVCP
jgi:hypothetical protein